MGRIEERKSQKILDLYFKAMASPKSIQPHLSKRVQKALRMNSEDNDVDGENADGETKAKRSKKSNTNRKTKKEERAIKPSVSIDESKALVEADDIALDKSVVPVVHDKSTKEYIPQREKDKASALEKKLHAIEVFRRSRQGLAKTKKVKRTVRKVKEEAELSESDSN